MKRLIKLIFLLLIYLNVNAQNQQLSKTELKEIIETHFITDEVPVRYYSNILIQLKGKVTTEDSIIINELIDTLNTLIATWDVHLIPEGTSNLYVEINNTSPNSELYSSSRLGNKKKQEIIESTVVIDIPEGSDFKTRKKIIYFHIIRALVLFNPIDELKDKLPGSIFVEKDYNSIEFLPADYQILAGLYSKKYDNELGSGYRRKISSLPAQEKTTLTLLGMLLSTILPILFLLVIFQKGIFINHNYVFREYLKQGVFVIISCLIALFCVLLTTLFIKAPEIPIKASFLIIGFTFVTILFSLLGLITIFILFKSEKIILKDSQSLLLQVVFPFLTTTFVPSLILILLVQFLPKPKGYSLYPLETLNNLLLLTSIFSGVAIFRSFLIFITKKSESIIHKKDVELARLSELHKQAELQSLRSKINPHFLYNSLNSIASLAPSDAKKTEQMALALSDFFKYSINREQKQMNPLSEELEAIKTYLEIEKVRFGERLNFEIVCPKNLLEIKIPQLLIQPLVENAIKHGISKIVEKGKIIIRVTQDNRQLEIRISDNGPEFQDGPLSGYGIRNTHERLDLLYGKKASINWENGAEKYIKITLPC